MSLKHLFLNGNNYVIVLNAYCVVTNNSKVMAALDMGSGTHHVPAGHVTAVGV